MLGQLIKEYDIIIHVLYVLLELIIETSFVSGSHSLLAYCSKLSKDICA